LTPLARRCDGGYFAGSVLTCFTAKVSNRQSTQLPDLTIPSTIQPASAVLALGAFHHARRRSVRLGPLQVRLADDRKMTLEQFWQQKKCLAVWEDG
jgi:hypothetical protein